jgi:hypothetical protein
MAKRPDDERDRATARGIQALYQDIDRTAIRRHSRDVILALLASGQINMCKVDGWHTLATAPIDQAIDLAAWLATLEMPVIAQTEFQPHQVAPIYPCELPEKIRGVMHYECAMTLYKLYSASWRKISIFVVVVLPLDVPEIEVGQRPSGSEPNLWVMRFRRLTAPPDAPFDGLNFDLSAEVYVDPSIIVRPQTREFENYTLSIVSYAQFEFLIVGRCRHRTPLR